MATCPDCEGDVRIRTKVRLGDLVVCANCGARLEVVELDPVELDYELDEEDDDWDAVDDGEDGDY